jgi:hypothetical protein
MAWSNKTKVSSTIERGRILTPDGNQILLGADEDLVLIYQSQDDYWSNKSKTTSSWSNKSKTIA